MGRHKGSLNRNKKDKFDSIPSTWKDALEGSNVEQLKEKLGSVAQEEEANRAAKAADEDLNQKKSAVKYAAQVYSETSKLNRLKLQWLIRNLSDKGDTVAESIVRLDISAAEQRV